MSFTYIVKSSVMKIFSICLGIACVIAIIASCQQQPLADNKQASIDSLKNIINQIKPGLGEFMMQIKYHHDELSKAITAKSYDRAAYEIDELKETAEKIQQLHITNDKLQHPLS